MMQARAIVVALALAASMAGPSRGPALAAVLVPLRWTSTGPDSLRLLEVRAPGDTINRNLWAGPVPLVLKARGGPAGLPDSGFVSCSTGFLERGATRLVLETWDDGAWGPPSNAVGIFYAARDTAWGLRPNGGWSTGPGFRYYVQVAGDTLRPEWIHLETIQREVLPDLCRIFGYACRRGERDTLWCEVLP